eukprot:m.146505 g.146505  ORF g.146505 m.146505 type:complete len:687 (+) comp16809_c0_seq1:187-2247(+)
MADKDYSPLTSSLVKGLNEKLYDKRKNAALEIEKMVKQFVAANEKTKIEQLISVLRREFIFSDNTNSRKGGLIGLAGTAIALGQSGEVLNEFLRELIPPVLACFEAPDSRVRYYACETMYNISKVARGETLAFFVRIFDGLSKLAADPDSSVKSGAELLDRLMKDIVTEHRVFDITNFVGLLSERIFSVNPHTRQFLVSWLTVLDSVPDIHLLNYLPNFLNGLFKILSDQSGEIRRGCENIMTEFLRELKEKDEVDFAAIVPILIMYCQSQDQLTKFTAITWVNEFVALAKRKMLPFVAELLGSILPSLASEVDVKIRDLATLTNQNLMKLVTDPTDNGLEGFNLAPTLSVLTLQFLSKSIPTRVASLRWVLKLQRCMPDSIFKHIDEIAPALLRTLSDQTDKVVLLDLEVLAEVSTPSPDGSTAERDKNSAAFFDKFIEDLLQLFSTDDGLLEKRGAFIIRHLCLLMTPERIYRALAGKLVADDDLEFAGLMVQNLSIILITAPELYPLRKQLKDLSKPENCSLFIALYRPWCHSPISTFALCLLTQCYDHACDLLQKFAELEVTVGFLVEIDKLIQLLESPVFTYVRMQLLEPQKNAYLVKALYGLIMLLPQSTAYHTLKARLDCVPIIISSLKYIEDTSNKPPAYLQHSKELQAAFPELLAHFDVVQKRRAETTVQRHRAGIE